jgi:N-ethylmaleimide reductase
MTRNRANADGVPGDLMATYYSQRASAGLIITEATQISPMGKGYIDTPGIHSPDQVRAWSRIVDSVHQNGGRIFLQLWHVGRISHTSLLPNKVQPLAPSAIRANGQTFIATGAAQVSEPVSMTTLDIEETLTAYGAAAHNAKEAGFDGVEIHAANGYLIDQFLESGTNQRNDSYGGCAANRVRFLAEVVERVIKVWDKERVGVRISPLGTFNDMRDDNPTETFSLVLERLRDYGVGYMHIVEPTQDETLNSEEVEAFLKHLRARWQGFYIVNGGYDRVRAEEVIESGYADAVTFGKPFIANPDFPKRLRLGASLNEQDRTTFYGGGVAGYIDYPALSELVGHDLKLDVAGERR